MLSLQEFNDLPDTSKYAVYTALFTLLESEHQRNEKLSKDLDYFFRCFSAVEKKYQDYCETVRKLMKPIK